MHHGTTGLSTLSFSTAPAQTEPSPLSNVAKLANATALEDNGILEDLQDPSEIKARDDDADENDSNNDQGDTEQESEQECDEEDATEKMVDADIVQMKTLRTTTSTHDDWLHRGNYLHDIAFHTYVEYVDRVRLPRHAPVQKLCSTNQHASSNSSPRSP